MPAEAGEYFHLSLLPYRRGLKIPIPLNPYYYKNMKLIAALKPSENAIRFDASSSENQKYDGCHVMRIAEATKRAI